MSQSAVWQPGSDHWFYSLLIEEKNLGVSRNELMRRLIDEGVQCRPVWKLNHMQKPYLSCQAYRIEKAYQYEAEILNVPCSTNLSVEDIEYVCNKITVITKKGP